MKNMYSLKIGISMALIALFISCKNELNTVDVWKDVPVIYGFLSIDDTASYVRVEKAFVDPNVGPQTLAQRPDSLYYADATVTLYRVRNPTEKFTLQKVDATTEGYPRNDGFFAKTPNFLYKIKSSRLGLKADEEWTIEVQKKGDTKPIAKAVTKVVGNFDITFPFDDPKRPLSISYDKSFTVRIENENEKTAKLFDVNIIVNYDETIGATTTKKKTVWTFASGVVRKTLTGGTPEPIVSFSRIGKDFYEFMKASVPVVAGSVRKFTGIDVEILSGGQELIEYLTVGQANIGITGSQSIPVFTNVQGGLGIFSSRSRVVKTNIQLDFDALDLLKSGEITRQLNFR
jgi:hypothetical protein